jgi:membrane-associated phospholipid phosphatase
MMKLRELQKQPEIALAAASGAAATAFGVLTRRSLAPRTIFGDLRLRARLPRYGRKTKKVAFQFGYLGKEWSVLPVAGLLGAKLFSDDRKAGAAAIVTATLAAVAASHIFDVALPQKTPPPGRRAPMDPHFPSGHALHSTALLGIAAWVLAREGLANRKAIAGGAGALAFALGFDRLVQDRHWTSDVIAGWLAAISISALAAAGYEKASRDGRGKASRSGSRGSGRGPSRAGSSPRRSPR